MRGRNKRERYKLQRRKKERRETIKSERDTYRIVLTIMTNKLKSIPIPNPISNPMISVAVNTTNHTTY